MLASLKTVLAWAEEHNAAVGAFNTPTLESLVAVLEAAEELNTPVIISHAELHEPEAPLDMIGPYMVFAAKRAKVPVCVHLDHGEHPDYIYRAIDMGFTAAMYDGSLLPEAENVKTTCDVVAYAHARGVDVEAEIGAMGSREGGGAGSGAVYTDPDEALRFVQATGIDALAASFGTAHGIYKEKPKLDFPRITRIREVTGLPLVMHGGSGVSPEDYRKAISCGVRKINYYTYMAKEGVKATDALLKARDVTWYHEIAAVAQAAMKEDVLKAMAVFMNKD